MAENIQTVIVKKELPSIKKAPTYEKNPYVKELKGKMYVVPKNNTFVGRSKTLVDTATGEILEEDVSLIGKRTYVDKSQFAKIYASEIGVLYDLSKPAQNVFLYLSKVMDYDNRAFLMYNKEFIKLGYKSETPTLKGLRELLSKNIIACDVRPHHFWLNPAIVCKGERFAIYLEYVKEENKTTGDLPPDPSSMHKLQRAEEYKKLPEEVQIKMELASRQKTLFDES